MAEHKITIFDILARIDAKDTKFYTDLPEHVQKAEHPLVLMKWMLGTDDPLKTIMLNEIVNPYAFSLHRHKPLVMQLLTVCASGNRTRYKWIPRKKGATVKYPALTSLIQQTYQYGHKKALDALALIPNEELLEYADDLGYQKDDMKDVKKEIRLRKKNEAQ